MSFVDTSWTQATQNRAGERRITSRIRRVDHGKCSWKLLRGTGRDTSPAEIFGFFRGFGVKYGMAALEVSDENGSDMGNWGGDVDLAKFWSLNLLTWRHDVTLVGCCSWNPLVPLGPGAKRNCTSGRTC